MEHLRTSAPFATLHAPMTSPAPTTPASPAPESGFDPLVFWMEHKQKIVVLLGLFAAALVIYFSSEYIRVKKLASSAAALASAKDTESLRKVTTDFAGTPPAGNAYLLIAENLRKEGKLDDAVAALRTMIDKYADHPLISGAWTSLASTLEAQGKTDEALSTYQKVSTTFSTSFSAPVALLGQARIYKEKGKTDEAKKLFDQVINQYPESLFAQTAMRESQSLKK